MNIIQKPIVPMPIKKLPILFVIALLVLNSCYKHRWTTNRELRKEIPPTKELRDMFFGKLDSTMVLKAKNLGKAYEFDAAEKDQDYGKYQDIMRFNQVEIKLLEFMPKDKVLVDIEFLDEMYTSIEVKNVDLLRFIPQYDTQGDMQYGESILEEYNRFGLNFRKGSEFKFNPHVRSQQMDSITDRVFKLNITNNCLEPSKFEMALLTEDFSDFKTRRKSGKNINQTRLLSHSWFYLDKNLYDYLMKVKNPHLEIDVDMHYDSITVRGEKAVVDFSQLRNEVKEKVMLTPIEIGAQSNRLLKPVDVEEYYKWNFGIFVNKDEFKTYTDVLEKPVEIARFGSRGFYNPETPNIYDYSYLKDINEIEMSILENPLTETYVELSFSGQYAPYKIVVGNVDLAQLDNQKLTGFLFGYNTYPKSRNYNPMPRSIFFDADYYPDHMKPYTLLVDKNTGTWVNNQKKGIEKVYISYESYDQDVLLVYFLSYERVTPIWMARLKIPKEMRETIRSKKLLYNN